MLTSEDLRVVTYALVCYKFEHDLVFNDKVKQVIRKMRDIITQNNCNFVLSDDDIELLYEQSSDDKRMSLCEYFHVEKQQHQIYYYDCPQNEIYENIILCVSGLFRKIKKFDISARLIDEGLKSSNSVYLARLLVIKLKLLYDIKVLDVMNGLLHYSYTVLCDSEVRKEKLNHYAFVDLLMFIYALTIRDYDEIENNKEIAFIGKSAEDKLSYILSLINICDNNTVNEKILMIDFISLKGIHLLKKHNSSVPRVPDDVVYSELLAILNISMDLATQINDIHGFTIAFLTKIRTYKAFNHSAKLLAELEDNSVFDIMVYFGDIINAGNLKTAQLETYNIIASVRALSNDEYDKCLKIFNECSSLFIKSNSKNSLAVVLRSMHRLCMSMYSATNDVNFLRNAKHYISTAANIKFDNNSVSAKLKNEIIINEKKVDEMIKIEIDNGRYAL